MKQQLREQEKKNHEEFRQQLIDDVAGLIRQWQEHLDQRMDANVKNHQKAAENVRQARQKVDRVSRELETIRTNTIKEVKAMKRGRSWKFYGACIGASLLGALVAVILCGMYWPTIQSILG